MEEDPAFQGKGQFFDARYGDDFGIFQGKTYFFNLVAVVAAGRAGLSQDGAVEGADRDVDRKFRVLSQMFMGEAKYNNIKLAYYKIKRTIVL